VTFYESTQSVDGYRTAMAQMLGIPRDALPGLRVWQQALAVDPLPAGCGGGQAPQPPREAGDQPEDDVPDAGRATKAGVATPGLFKDAKASDLSFTAGSVHHKDQPAASGTPFDKVIAAAKTSSVSGQGRSQGTISDMIGVTKPSFSSQIEGAVAMGIGMALFEELVHDPNKATRRTSSR
jgi:Molybdopterin-binding domain of aldehyde dehydrogenase